MRIPPFARRVRPYTSTTSRIIDIPIRPLNSSIVIDATILATSLYESGATSRRQTKASKVFWLWHPDRISKHQHNNDAAVSALNPTNVARCPEDSLHHAGLRRWPTSLGRAPSRLCQRTWLGEFARAWSRRTALNLATRSPTDSIIQPSDHLTDGLISTTC